jgi:hypothetical protein
MENATLGADPWLQLMAPSAPTRGEFRVLDSGIAVDAGSVLMALDSKGLRHLLVPIDTATFSADRRSAGVHLAPRVLEDDHGRRTFVDLACQNPALNGIFSHLARDVLADLAAEGREPLPACRRVLSRWRAFFDRTAAGVLSVEAAAGLFAELWHLREILKLDSSMLARWQGPEGAAHDFRGTGLSLEVKALLQRDGWSIRVHGTDQLDPPPGGALILAAMRVSISEGPPGESLPSVIDGLVPLGVDARGLQERLHAAGYHPGHADILRELSFAVVEQRIFGVDVSFPRITNTSFVGGGAPPGTSRLEYDVDLSHAASFELPAGSIGSVHRRLCGLDVS